MTDYLELLLERRQREDEEDRWALTLGPEERAFPGKRESKGTGAGPEPSTESGAQGWVADMDHGPVRAGAAGPGFTASKPRAETAGELLVRRLELVQDALAGRAEGQAPAVPDISGLPPMRGTASAAGEGLARRLARISLASTPAPARVLFDGDAGPAPAAGDWEAFDQQLERDARRYDGGLGLY